MACFFNVQIQEIENVEPMLENILRTTAQLSDLVPKLTKVNTELAKKILGPKSHTYNSYKLNRSNKTPQPPIEERFWHWVPCCQVDGIPRPNRRPEGHIWRWQEADTGDTFLYIYR